MCFHCDNGNRNQHIPTVYRKTYMHTFWTGEVVYKCTYCMKQLTKEQFEGTSPHWCDNRYIMLEQRPETEELDLWELIRNWRSHPLTATVTLKTGEIKFYLKGIEWKPKT